MLLAGDVGATKTVLALFSAEDGPRMPRAEATFLSSRYPSLETMVREYLGQTGQHITRAVFGVAGPIISGRAYVTNLSWIIEQHALQAALEGIQVGLLNDLEAIAHAVPSLTADDLHTLNQGEPEPGGAIAVIAPGTGLGEGYLTWDGTRYTAHPSEGGHCDFAATNPREVELLRYLMDRYGHVSYERVCSGLGIPNIYAYLRDSGFAVEPAWLAQKLEAATDPTPIIVSAALETADPPALCTETLRMFVGILATEAGNLALKLLATGGVYLAGGIPPRILPALDPAYFMARFTNKGRLAELLRRIPVHVILNPKAALFGAARYGLMEATSASS